MQPLNVPRWPEARGRFYEVWYFKLNMGTNAPALWLRMTVLLQPEGKRVAETWGIFFSPTGSSYEHVAVKETFPLSSFTQNKKGIRIGDCIWEDGHTSG